MRHPNHERTTSPYSSRAIQTASADLRASGVLLAAAGAMSLAALYLTFEYAITAAVKAAG
jgi:hypothetical protein